MRSAMTGPAVAQPEERRLSSWCGYAGDVGFVITAPADWLPAQLELLSQYLPPPPGDLELAPIAVHVHTDDRLFRQVDYSAAASPHARRIETVPGLVMLESRQADGSDCYSIAEDAVEGLPGAYAVAVRERRMSLYLHRQTERPHRYPIRLIREAMLRTYEDASGIIFHAAGIDAGGAGVMICGPAGAGKTTVAAALLRQAGITLLSGDRVVVIGDKRMVAVPLPVSVARGTIEAFAEIRNALPAGVRPAQGAIGQLPADFGTRVKCSFTPVQFAQAFGTGISAASTLRLVIVPRLTDTAEPAALERLRGAQAHSVLAESCFTPRDEFWVKPWLIPRRVPASTLRRQADAVIEAIAAGVPCVTVRFGVRGQFSDLERALAAALEEIGT
jgi:hypothetical protein